MITLLNPKIEEVLLKAVLEFKKEDYNLPFNFIYHGFELSPIKNTGEFYACVYGEIQGKRVEYFYNGKILDVGKKVYVIDKNFLSNFDPALYYGKSEKED